MILLQTLGQKAVRVCLPMEKGWQPAEHFVNVSQPQPVPKVDKIM